MSEDLARSSHIDGDLAGKGVRVGVCHFIAQTLQDTMHRIPSMTELSERLAGDATAGWDQLVGLTGMVDPATLGRWGDAYPRELTALYMQLQGQEQWQIDLAVQSFKNSWDERINKVRDSAKEMESVQDEMRRSADSPTCTQFPWKEVQRRTFRGRTKTTGIQASPQMGKKSLLFQPEMVLGTSTL